MCLSSLEGRRWSLRERETRRDLGVGEDQGYSQVGKLILGISISYGAPSTDLQYRKSQFLSHVCLFPITSQMLPILPLPLSQLRYSSEKVINCCQCARIEEYLIIMNSFLQIKNLYEEPTSTSHLFLKQLDPLKAILEQRCLVFFLRYVENLPHMGMLEVVKTLFLWCRLSRVDHKKMTALSGQSGLPVELSDNVPIDKPAVAKLLYSKMLSYFRAVSSSQSDIPTSQQIQLLTCDLHRLKELSEEGLSSWGRMSELVLWLAEEQLYTLWVHIEHQLPYFMDYDQQKFDVFYEQYCTFCSNRRKIPIIRHKMLKTVRINIYINQQIEQKGKELKQQQEGRGYVFRLKRGEGLADFEEDEEEDEEE